MRSNPIEIVENEITIDNWLCTPKYSTIANICNHAKNCKYNTVCGHAITHKENENCKKDCKASIGKCYDVSATGMWV